MDKTFPSNEKLYRAVYPPEVMEMFWKRNGSLSSAAFADAKGLSVDRGDFRPDTEVVESMHRRFNGHIISFYVKNCIQIGAVVKYCPSKANPYHSEIHGSESTPLLSKSQRHFLASRSVVIG